MAIEEAIRALMIALVAAGFIVGSLAVSVAALLVYWWVL